MQEGEFEGHDYIGANDKDFILAFKHLCSLCTLHIFEWMQQIDGHENPYSEDQVKSLVGFIDAFLEDEGGWKDQVFGYESKLSLADFCKNVCQPDAAYIFDMAQMRQKVLEKAHNMRVLI